MTGGVKSLISARPIEYSALRLLGEGSSGVVYRAIRKDGEFGIEQPVAIKILKSEIAVEDCRAEFSVLSRVTSHRCVRVLGWDRLDDRPALILELVDGVTLERLVRHHRLSQDETDEIISQIFEGLQDISKCGLSHGDLSLKNVMLNVAGEVKILDFGLFRGGRGQFTPEFAAPEIFEQTAPTFFSDLYSLGRIQYFIETKAQRVISAATLKMLALRPEDRDFILNYVSERERSVRRERLAQLVAETQAAERIRVRAGSSWMTTIINARSTRVAWIRHGLLWMALALGLGAGPATADRRPAHLYIRTTVWSEVTVNGRYAGYSPLDLNVNAGENLRLEFNTPMGKVVRTLTLSPGQNKVLDDAFLKGNSHGRQLVK